MVQKILGVPFCISPNLGAVGGANSHCLALGPQSAHGIQCIHADFSLCVHTEEGNHCHYLSSVHYRYGSFGSMMDCSTQLPRR